MAIFRGVGINEQHRVSLEQPPLRKFSAASLSVTSRDGKQKCQMKEFMARYLVKSIVTFDELKVL